MIFCHSTYSQVSDTFDPIDIFDVEYVSDPQISPGGDKVLYQRNFKDVMTDRNLSNIWMVNFDGSQNSLSQQEIGMISHQGGHTQEINLHISLM